MLTLKSNGDLHDGYHLVPSAYERPFNTEKNAIYRFSISFSFQSYKGLKMAKSA